MPCIGTADAIGWNRLSPAQTISRLLELGSDALLNHLPELVWPEIITPDLSPDAMRMLFCRSVQQDSTMFRSVLKAMVSHNWFSHPENGQLVIPALAALRPDELAHALETISDTNRSQAGRTLRKILENAQKAGNGAAVRRFQEAMTLVSIEVCERVATYCQPGLKSARKMRLRFNGTTGNERHET